MKPTFEASYLQELEARMSKSQVVCSQTHDSNKAVLFYDRQEDLFTFLVQIEGQEESIPYDCKENLQWGRKVLVLGSKTATGGFIAQGHLTIDPEKITARFPSGMLFAMEADCSAPFLKRLIPETKASGKNKRSAHAFPQGSLRRDTRAPQSGRAPMLAQAAYNNADHEEDDLTEEDLARLRGDIPFIQTARQRQR